MLLKELADLSRGLPSAAPPIPVVISGLGQVGHVSGRHGFYLNSAIRREVLLLQREELRVERLARSMSNGRLGSEDILKTLRRGTDLTDSIRLIKSARALLDSWDALTTAKQQGLWSNAVLRKTIVFTGPTAGCWQCMARAAGSPGAATYTAIPGSPLDADSAGAPVIFPRIEGQGNPYLACTSIAGDSNVGTISGRIFLLVDLLNAADNISTNVTTTQNIITPDNLRWTDNEGVMMALEVSSLLGVTVDAVATVNYLNQSGNPSSTTIQLLVAAGVQRLMAGVGIAAADANALAARLAIGERGVKSITSVTLNAVMGGTGTLAGLLFKPIVLMTYFAFGSVSQIPVNWLEVELPLQGMIRKLTDTSSLPFLTYLLKHDTTSGTGVFQALLEFAWG